MSYRPGDDRKTIANERAKVVFTKKETEPGGDFDNPNFRPEINRYPLRNMQLKSLRAETVVWDSQFISMASQAGSWRRLFKSPAFRPTLVLMKFIAYRE